MTESFKRDARVQPPTGVADRRVPEEDAMAISDHIDVKKGLVLLAAPVAALLLVVVIKGGDSDPAAQPEAPPPTASTPSTATPTRTPTPTPTRTPTYKPDLAGWSVELTVDDTDCGKSDKWCLLEYSTGGVSGDIDVNPIPAGKSVKLTYQVKGWYPYRDVVLIDSADQDFTPVTNAVESKRADQDSLEAKVVAVELIDTKAEDAADLTTTAVTAIPVKGRAPKTGYSREKFGDDWTSHYTNCDTRETIQRRDIDEIKVASADRCKVVGGELYDNYTGKTIKITKSNIDKYEVDHVVSLSDAWQKGAQSWSAAKRKAFANDPANLGLTSQKVNAQKGDGDAATWLPPEKSCRCAYVSQQVSVKQNYGLWVTAAEQKAMSRVLTSCRDETIATEDLSWTNVDDKVTVVKPKPKAKPKPEPKTEPQTDPQFGTCREANAAGYGPYVEGLDPEYDWYQDRDGDGIVCER